MKKIFFILGFVGFFIPRLAAQSNCVGSSSATFPFASSPRVNCVNNSGISVITTGSSSDPYPSPISTILCNTPVVAFAGTGIWTGSFNTGFLTYTFSQALSCATVTYSAVNGPLSGVDIGRITVNGGGTVSLTNVCGANVTADTLTCNLTGYGDVVVKVNSTVPFTTITLTNIGGQSGWVQGNPCNFILNDCSSCSDTCFWRLTGNNIIGTNNIFGTTSNHDIRIVTNNTPRGVFTNTGNFGLGINSPSAQLHTNGSVRFAGITNANQNRIMALDTNGNVFWRDASTLTTSPWNHIAIRNINMNGFAITNTTNTSASAALQSNTFPGIRLDRSGNVRVGTTAPAPYTGFSDIPKFKVDGDLEARQGIFTTTSLPDGSTFVDGGDANDRCVTLAAGSIIGTGSGYKRTRMLNFFDFPASNLAAKSTVYFGIEDRNDMGRFRMIAQANGTTEFKVMNKSQEDLFRFFEDGNDNGVLTLPKASSSFAIGTATPLAQLHTTGSVKFEGITNANQNRIMTLDVDGNVYWRDASTLTANISASQGITFDGNQVLLGDKCGGGGSLFKENREINLDDFSLYFNSVSSNSVDPENPNSDGKIYIGPPTCKPLEARLEINTLGQSNKPENDYVSPNPSPSGLRFTNLNMFSPVTRNLAKGVLSLDRDGDVIWVERDWGITSITNTLTSTNNTMTSTVNSITSSAPIINSYSLSFSGNTLSSSINGVTSSVTIPVGGNTTNTCATLNRVPKLTGTNTFGCSQIFDDGTSVGINASSGFAYTNHAGIRLGATIPATSGTVRLQVNGVLRSVASIVTSDGKLKTDVKDLKDALSIVNELKGKTYSWTKEAQQTKGIDNGRHAGFIAQELQKVLPELVIEDENKELGVNYIEIIPILTEAIKELNAKVENQNNAKVENEKLKLEVNDLKSELKELRELILNKQADSKNEISSPVLYQNVPNPFSSTTTIRYNVPNCKGECKIIISDISGRLIYTHVIEKSGEGSFQFDSSKFSSSANFLYSLIVDGKHVANKKMLFVAD